MWLLLVFYFCCCCSWYGDIVVAVAVVVITILGPRKLILEYGKNWIAIIKFFVVVAIVIVGVDYFVAI